MARRKALKLTAEHVAHEAGLSIKYYSDVENGKRPRVSVDAASRIAQALEWKLQRLLDKADTM